MPSVRKEIQGIGHFPRNIPRDYLFARKTGSLERMDPSLAKYYRPLRSITSDPLWSWGRITNIVAFNRGKYDHLLQEYLERRR